MLPGGLGSHHLRLHRKQRVLRSASTSQRPGCGNCFRSGKGCQRPQKTQNRHFKSLSVRNSSPRVPKQALRTDSYFTPTSCRQHARPKCTLMLRLRAGFGKPQATEPCHPFSLPYMHTSLTWGTHTQCRRLSFSVCRPVLSNALSSRASLGFLCSQELRQQGGPGHSS